jgi:hypothetical protein
VDSESARPRSGIATVPMADARLALARTDRIARNIRSNRLMPYVYVSQPIEGVPHFDGFAASSTIWFNSGMFFRSGGAGLKVLMYA